MDIGNLEKFRQDADSLLDSEMQELRGGKDAQVAESCGACCSISSGGTSSSKDLEAF
jgi:hypothetical protein